jgi:hypothetical protein
MNPAPPVTRTRIGGSLTAPSQQSVKDTTGVRRR